MRHAILPEFSHGGVTFSSYVTNRFTYANAKKTSDVVPMFINSIPELFNMFTFLSAR